MDSLITAAARALAAGDPLGALNRVALREDPPALALRGLAMAQLGDFARARALLRQAARRFGPRAAVARARCVVAEAEIALVSRDLAWRPRALQAARLVLEARGDRAHAAHARHLELRRLLLLGRLDEAERGLGSLDPALLPPATRAAQELVAAGIALRRLRTASAREALARAARAASLAGIPALIAGGDERPLRLHEVEALLASPALVVDACRYAVGAGGRGVALAGRPVLFALARALAEAWPRDVARGVLLARAFRARTADESHRARLRVEIGRLRRLLAGFAAIEATQLGFALRPREGRRVVVLAHSLDEAHGAVLALLADGEAWSSSALALALGTSQRSVQRALESLASRGKVQAVGRGRARRWMMPALPGITTTLLLPATPPGD